MSWTPALAMPSPVVIIIMTLLTPSQMLYIDSLLPEEPRISLLVVVCSYNLIFLD